MVYQGPRFFLVVSDHAKVVHEEELNFNALFHDVTFSAVCRGSLPNDGKWGPTVLQTRSSGNRVEAVVVTVGGASRTYDRAVFRDRALEVLLNQAVAGESRADEKPELSWDLQVRDTAATGRRRARASVRHQPYPLRQGSRPLAVAIPRDGDDRLSIRISADLLADLHEVSTDSLDREQVSFLTGHLVREPSGRVSVLLLDRLQATAAAGSSRVHFGFSPQTFLAARSELERRESGQVILGWHHNHPPPCGRECLMKVPACDTENVFFSLDDRAVHRSAFDRPYMVALVSGKGKGLRADDPLMRAYGWQRGRIRRRRWTILRRSDT
jgi:hypothetical protein